MTGATQTYISTDAGADTLELTGGSKQTSVYGGEGNDSLNAQGGGTSLKIYGEAGNDTLSWNANSTDSVFDAGAGTDYIEGTNTLSGSSVFGGAGADTLDVTSDSGKYYAGAGADSLYVSMTSGSVYGGSSAGDTAAGNDTLDIVAMTTGYINMGDGANKMEASAIISAGTIVSGAGSDTFTTSTAFGGGSDTRIGTGSGNDSLYFASGVSSGTTVVNAGAGNDTLQFTELVSSASIVGGAGNDSVLHLRSGYFQLHCFWRWRRSCQPVLLRWWYRHAVLLWQQLSVRHCPERQRPRQSVHQRCYPSSYRNWYQHRWYYRQHFNHHRLRLGNQPCFQ